MQEDCVTGGKDLKKIVKFKIKAAITMEEIIHDVDDYDSFYVDGCDVEFEENDDCDVDAIYEGELGLFLKSDNPRIRAALAESGWALDILINDPNENVRCAVAKQGYGLEKLAHDHSRSVRLAASIKKDGFDVHSNEFFKLIADDIAKMFGLPNGKLI